MNCFLVFFRPPEHHKAASPTYAVQHLLGDLDAQRRILTGDVQPSHWVAPQLIRPAHGQPAVLLGTPTRRAGRLHDLLFRESVLGITQEMMHVRVLHWEGRKGPFGMFVRPSLLPPLPDCRDWTGGLSPKLMCLYHGLVSSMHGSLDEVPGGEQWASAGSLR